MYSFEEPLVNGKEEDAYCKVVFLCKSGHVEAYADVV